MCVPSSLACVCLDLACAVCVCDLFLFLQTTGGLARMLRDALSDKERSR